MATLLGDFLRARRDATAPATLGLPTGPRRRAPGVRRSELATLAGISVEYLTRLEQGRDRRPSPGVIAAIADALRLDAAEREHLRHLTRLSSGTCTAGRTPTGADTVRSTVLRLLDQLEPGIAIVTNRIGEILAHTDTFALLAAGTGLLDARPSAGAAPSLTRYVFLDPRARTVFPDRDALADELALDLLLGPSLERVERFLDEMARDGAGDLRTRMDGRSVPRRGTLRWVHPAAGVLRLDREILELPAADAQQIVVFLPADEVTAQAVDGLRRRDRPALRAVT